MAVEIIMPKLGVDMQEGEILEWKKQVGDVVNEGDVLLEIMSDKTNMEIEAEDSGVLLKITHGNGDVVPVTETIGYIGAEGEEVTEASSSENTSVEENATQVTSEPEKVEETSEPSVPAATSGEKVRATPAARKLAREMSIDLALVSGTGANGRVHREDVENFKGAQPRITPLARRIAED
ncbi:TPA: E3 binding domain-containing protein, partial [Streptococcus agalactiae]|nr:E3 binding domain-containing protein [Streptococcus agalactiae]